MLYIYLNYFFIIRGGITVFHLITLKMNALMPKFIFKIMNIIIYLT